MDSTYFTSRAKSTPKLQMFGLMSVCVRMMSTLFNTLNRDYCSYPIWTIEWMSKETIEENEVYLPHDEIWVYDTESGLWQMHLTHGDLPPSMSGSCGACLNGRLYIFGGYDDKGYSNQLYYLDLRPGTGEFTWKQVKHFKGQPPTARDKLSCWVYKHQSLAVCFPHSVTAGRKVKVKAQPLCSAFTLRPAVTVREAETARDLTDTRMQFNACNQGKHRLLCRPMHLHGNRERTNLDSCLIRHLDFLPVVVYYVITNVYTLT
ncbi:unnamed protein product [Ranitomeya imitator]|uniref:Uncharacterized protein n=1 Tax=Ranitomeya imitator TaxID=111125 RepID=A0ABN9LXD9_9NEOB|nr:unnamed protein product [Ranitomeya imitator]